jgi:DNA-binding MarR family transcriptional regulator
MDNSLPTDNLSSEYPGSSQMPTHNAYYTLVQAYVLFSDGDQRVLNRFGLSWSQLAVLKLLDPVKGVRPMDLTGPLLLEKSSISRLLDRLVEEQLVERIVAPGDRRSHYVIITQRGLALRERAAQAYEHSLDERLSVLSPAEQQHLHDLLAKLCQHLQATLALI